MRLPRDLSGDELAQLLCRHWDYCGRVHQKGSHLTLETLTPSKHRVTIPLHPAFKVGTLRAVLGAVAYHKGVSRDDLLQSRWYEGIGT